MAPKKKQMTEEAKARLRAAQEAKKGRSSLRGLDQTLGMVALDYVQERDGEHPGVIIDFDSGRVRFSNSPLSLQRPGPANWSYWDDECYHVRLTRYYARTKTPEDKQLCWVRLSHCPEWITTEFRKRFPEKTRRIVVRKFAGPRNPRVATTETVVDAALVMAWLRFLWPEPLEFGERVERYCVAYSKSWVQLRPGVGAKINIRLNPSSVVLDRMTTGKMYEVTRFADWMAFTQDDEGLEVYLGAGDWWTVVG